MIPNRLRTSFIAPAFLLTMLACAIPGLTFSQSDPLLDENAMNTAIAKTFSAPLTQTAAAVPPQLSATPTLPAPASTPTPEVSSAGNSLIPQADGSTLYVDYKTGFQLTIPPNWLSVRAGQKEYYHAFEKEVINFPWLTDELTIIQDDDPDKIRLHAFDIGTTINQDRYYVSHIYILWVEDLQRSFEKEIELMLDAQRQSFPDTEVISEGTEEFTASGIRMVVLEYTSSVQNIHGQDIEIFEIRVLLQAKIGSVNVSLSTLVELKDSLKPAFDQLLNEMALLDQ